MIHGQTRITQRDRHKDANRQTESYCAVRECQYKPKVKQCDLLKDVVQKKSFYILTKRIK